MSAKIEDNSPVTVSIARRVLKGKEADYEAWLRRTISAAKQFPGHLGVDVLRPSPQTSGDYVLIVRFDSYAHQRDWEISDTRAALLLELSEITEGDTRVKKASGLEFWFSLPDVPQNIAPSRHKMALVLSVVVFTLVLLVNLLLGDWLSQLPLIPRVLILALSQVLLLTYVVMPQVTRLLRNWLYQQPR